MKIRFYHWWVYSLYYKLWAPILASRPEMVQSHIDWMTEWLAYREKIINENKSSQ